MDALEYQRLAVLERLKSNRNKHKDIYDDALEGFYEAVVKELEEVLELAKAGKEYRLTLKQTKPVEHLKEYDRAIAMMEFSCQDKVLLEQREFDQYIMDNWSWSDTFAGSSLTYGKGLR